MQGCAGTIENEARRSTHLSVPQCRYKGWSSTSRGPGTPAPFSWLGIRTTRRLRMTPGVWQSLPTATFRPPVNFRVTVEAGIARGSSWEVHTRRPGVLYVYLCIGAPPLENKDIDSASVLCKQPCGGTVAVPSTGTITVSWLFDDTKGTLGVRIDEEPWTRMFEDVDAGEVYCGFFLRRVAESHIEAFSQTDVTGPRPIRFPCQRLVLL
jgi:hypothetical protein